MNKSLRSKMMKRRLLLLVLLFAVLPGRAQNNYVFYNDTYGYLYNDNGTLRSSTSLQFNKSSAWTAADALGNTNRTITPYNVTNLYLRTSTNNGGTVSLNAASSNWQSRTYLCVRSGNTNYYLKATNATTFTTASGNNGNRYTPYAVTISDGAELLTDFSINSGAESISTTGNYAYGHSNAEYTPAYTDYEFSGTHHYIGSDNSALANINPSTVTTGYTWSLSDNASGYATMSGSSVVVSTLPTYDLVITLTCSVTNHGITKSSTKEILLQGTTVAAPTITRSGNNVTLATITSGATIYYTTDGSTPSSSSAVYSGPINIASLTFPVTVKAVAIRNGNSSDPASETYSQPACEVPVITVSTTGVVTITCATEGATIRYTSGVSPADPTGSSPAFTSLTLSQGEVVKAIATKSGYISSAVATAEYVETGISGGKVILDDREDHGWSYYSDASTPAQLHSLNPADVKITYFGDGIMMTGDADYTASSTDFVLPGNANYVGGAKVNVGGENENTFVYYKTLERENADGTGRCPYKPIPNPFQVRPTYGSAWDGTNTATWTGWRGFQCWRLKRVTGGSVYSGASGGSAFTTGAVINAETEIFFAPNSEYGMEVDLEAVWAIAYVVKANGSENAIQEKNVGYERNFIVLHSTNTSFNFGGSSGTRITNIDFSATVSTYYPDGTQGANSGSTLRGAATNYNLTLEANTKFENIQFNLNGNNNSNTLTAANHDVIIGRGCTGTVNNLQGINAGATDLDYTIRLESGTYNQFCFVRNGTNTTVSGRYLIKAIMGSDYDRATGTNNKLIVSPNSTLFFAQTVGFTGSSNKDQKTFDCVFKSGTYQSGYWTESAQNGNPESDQTIQNAYQRIAYLGQNSAQGNTYPGVRYVTVEGGEFSGMCGGRGVGGNSVNAMTPEVITFDVRIKGGTFHGAVYGGAADNPSIGSRRFIITGGEIQSWIAGGCNGTGSITNGTGATDGDSYIYVGGTTLVGGDNAMCINRTNGGQVFGAGRGLAGRASSVNHSHVAIADEAVIRNGNNNGSYPVGGNVYGGSYNGTIANVSNVYILGGRVEGSAFGGSYGNGTAIPTVNVTMTGGLVTNGVYGGSNNTGTISGNVTMQIDGGTVGNSETGDGIFGGGFGAATVISGNVSLTLGSSSSVDGATVNGNVYGGSALGDVNANNTNTTTVTMNKALINGNLFGAGKGSGADVHGKVTVTINGGTVNGNVFGGGDEAAYNIGTNNLFPVVNVTGGTMTNVFGGGDNATVTGSPQVTIHRAATVTSNVFGGGNEGAVSGNTNVLLTD